MPTDAELLAASRHDPEALGQFYDRHERAVLAYFARRVRDAETAAELTAETFAEVVRQCRRGVDVQEPPAWLFAIARGRLVDFQRRGVVADRARRRLGLERLRFDDEALERIEALGSEPLAVALEGLPEPEREAVLARVVDEHEYARIARDQAISEPAARKRVSRALARLRRTLEGPA
jgi:RNA polymerase sigma-70 factor (ECF subfamily)